MAEYRAFLQDLIQSRHPLLGGILAFNRRLVSRLRPDVLSPAGRILAPLAAGERASARLARRLPLLAEWPHPYGLLDFRVPRHRLALLPEESLVHLARWHGLTRHRTEVATLIDRADVLALRAEVGEAGHIFALRRSSLLPGARETAPTAAGGAESAPLPERIRRTGFAAIARCLADAAPALRDALALIPPVDFAAHFTAAGGEAAAAHAAAPDEWPLLSTLLFKELDPAWARFFS
jgi:hypothetical protein